MNTKGKSLNSQFYKLSVFCTLNINCYHWPSLDVRIIMKLISRLTFLGFFLVQLSLTAQVTLDPFFASNTDTVLVTFDATQGNGELAGTTQVYAHTGVITNLSTSGSDWRHVVGTWGTADPLVQMTAQGNNMHTIELDLNNFYALDPGEQILALAFVFRNADGSLVGRAADGGDIFVPLFSGGFAAVLTNPVQDEQLITAHQTISIGAVASSSSSISLYVDDSLLLQATGVTNLNTDFQTVDFGPGKHYVWMECDNGMDVVRDSAYYLFHTGSSVTNVPAGLQEGINYISDTSVILKFSVPFKNFIYVVGDFNDWTLDPNYLCNRTPDNNVHWIQINGLEPGKEYRFQYAINQELMKVADIYSHKILDPWNDQYIDNETYPDLIEYPVGKTTEAVSILQTAQVPFPWDETINYSRPDQEKLVIYELLIRDFVQEHNYQTLTDSLDYLQKLGVNAIGLMPFNEFEGNESWGYNPSFYFAPDKYYGTEEALKTFIQEAHRRGIAVVMDMVLNHSFGQNPQVRMFFDQSAGQWGQPTAQNPWFLETPAHDFNVGYDYDHESTATRQFVDRVMRYWVEEFKVDGYRMDLSKGFTSNVTIGNVGLFGQYDASRVANLKRMADQVWDFNPDTYIILEHFADNNEETELSNYGFMLWGNMNHAFSEASMGYGGDLSWISHKTRGWDNAHVVGYAESHDEERMMYRNLNFGGSEGDYSVQDFHIATQRAELAAVFLLTVPGPKMIWQFGEMGYDFSINRCPDGTISNDCRLSNKPIRWDYLLDGNRKRLFDVYAALNNLRQTYPTFTTDDFEMDVDENLKTIGLNHPDMNAIVVGNFDLKERNIRPYFQNTGTWYEYFSGEELEVGSTEDFFPLKAGEYRIYTDVKLDQPDIAASVEELMVAEDFALFPNPASDQVTLKAVNEEAFSLTIYNAQGSIVYQRNDLNSKEHTITTTTFESGVYIVEMQTGVGVSHQTLIIQ